MLALRDVAAELRPQARPRTFSRFDWSNAHRSEALRNASWAQVGLGLAAAERLRIAGPARFNLQGREALKRLRVAGVALDKMSKALAPPLAVSPCAASHARCF